MLEHARTQTLHFSTFSNTAGLGKARMWWLAQAEYAKVHLHFCTFGWYGWHGQRKGGVVGTSRICKNAFLRFRLVWLAWVKRIAWLAQKEYAKVQRCSFCIFALSAGMAGIVKLMKMQMAPAKTYTCTWLVRLAWAKDGAKSPTD